MKKEEALKEAKENMEFKVHDIKEDLTNSLKNIQKAETFEEFMEAKRTLMLKLVNSPTGISYCPYCLQNDFQSFYEKVCQDCEYGKEHGRCLEDGSDYMQLMKAFGKLEKQINKYW